MLGLGMSSSSGTCVWRWPFLSVGLSKIDMIIPALLVPLLCLDPVPRPWIGLVTCKNTSPRSRSSVHLGQGVLQFPSDGNSHH